MEGSTTSMPDKTDIVCPLSLALGVVQNYRCSWKSNRGVWESRPVASADKYADAFFKVLQAPKGEHVTVKLPQIDPETGNQREITLKGLGQTDAMALKFRHEDGVKARHRAIEMVNDGKIRAPKKNWDQNFHPQGGKLLDDLKKEFPALYGGRTDETEEQDDSDIITSDDLDLELDTELGATEAQASDLDLDDEELVSEEEMAEEEEPAFAVTAVEDEVEVPDLDMDMEIEDTTKPGESAAQASQQGRLQGAAQARHQAKEQTGSGRVEEFDASQRQPAQKVRQRFFDERDILVIAAPMGASVVTNDAFKFMDDQGNERTMYRIQHPVTGKQTWMEAGGPYPDECTHTFELRIQHNN